MTWVVTHPPNKQTLHAGFDPTQDPRPLLPTLGIQVKPLVRPLKPPEVCDSGEL